MIKLGKCVIIAIYYTSVIIFLIQRGRKFKIRVENENFNSIIKNSKLKTRIFNSLNKYHTKLIRNFIDTFHKCHFLS
jgi:hypothetical protein